MTPTLGSSLAAAGYDTNFAALGARLDPPRYIAAPDWRAVRVDRARGTLTVPAGVSLDLGATAKAYATDRAALDIAARFGGGVLVALGGDLAVAGTTPSGGWPVWVDDAHDAPTEHAERIRRELRRRWPPPPRPSAGGGAAPSGCTTSSSRAPDVPAATGWRTVSVAAATLPRREHREHGGDPPRRRRAVLAGRAGAARATGGRRRGGPPRRGLAGRRRRAGRGMSGSALWYLVRGEGIVSLTLLTVTMLLGIGTWTRWASARWPRRFGNGLHRNVALLGLSFVALHAVTAVADGFVPLRLLDIVVPFEASYRPLWVGLGALAFDLLLALAITSLLQRRLGWRRWRATHWAAYACWPVAVVHGLRTGTDAGSPLFSALRRLLHRGGGRRRGRALGLGPDLRGDDLGVGAGGRGRCGGPPGGGRPQGDAGRPGACVRRRVGGRSAAASLSARSRRLDERRRTWRLSSSRTASGRPNREVVRATMVSRANDFARPAARPLPPPTPTSPPASAWRSRAPRGGCGRRRRRAAGPALTPRSPRSTATARSRRASSPRSSASSARPPPG